jgi:hypothetical protein
MKTKQMKPQKQSNNVKTKKPIRFVAAGDNHGDMADPEALGALFAFCKDYKPDVRIALGDCFDFRSLRRGVGNDAESAESLKSDIDAGLDFLNKYRPDVYLFGNHEARLDALISTSGSAIVRDYCHDVKDEIIRGARKAGAKTIIPYHAEKGVYRLGPVAFIHGYAYGNNATTEQGRHYADRGGALIHGHTHNLAQINLTKHEGGVAFSAGCLCRKEEMDYASHRLATSRWGSGFAAGWIDGDDWKVFLVHKVGGRWIWQSDLTIWTPPK